jgi:Ca2+/Na+ antiporter
MQKQVAFNMYLITATLLLIISFITTFKRRESNQNAGILLALLFWVAGLTVFVVF